MKEIFKAYNLHIGNIVQWDYIDEDAQIQPYLLEVVFNEKGQKALQFGDGSKTSDFKSITAIIKQTKLQKFRYRFMQFRKSIWSIIRHTFSHGAFWNNNFDERMKICEACPWKDKRLGVLFCGDCGCSMPLKARFGGASCPQGRW